MTSHISGPLNLLEYTVLFGTRLLRLLLGLEYFALDLRADFPLSTTNTRIAGFGAIISSFYPKKQERYRYDQSLLLSC